MSIETAVKTWESIEYEGKPARLYPDGAIRNERGHFITQHPAGADYQIQTSADARNLAIKRHEDTKLAIQAAVLAEVASHHRLPAHTPVHAYAAVVAKQTQTLWDTDKPRFDDVEKLGQLMDLVPRKQAEQAGTAVTPLAQALVQIIGMLQDDTYTTHIEGHVVEPDARDSAPRSPTDADAPVKAGDAGGGQK